MVTADLLFVIRKIFDFGLKTVGSVPNPECVRLKRLLMFWMLKMTTIIPRDIYY